jgi:hypothetical protein
MSDIDPRTQDVTLRDDTTGVAGSVNADNEQLTHDAAVLAEVAKISGNTGGIPTSWQFFTSQDEGFGFTKLITPSLALETDFILLDNPTEDIDMRVRDVVLSIFKTNLAAELSFYRNPTITANGIAIPTVNFRDDIHASLMNVYFAPTILARGTRLFEAFGSFSGSFLKDEDLAMYILPGETMLMTIIPSLKNNDYVMSMAYAESPQE